MLLVIPVGEMVTVENELEARVVQISIRKTHIMYEVEKVTENGISSWWAYDWQITSKHKKIKVYDVLKRQI